MTPTRRAFTDRQCKAALYYTVRVSVECTPDPGFKFLIRPFVCIVDDRRHVARLQEGGAGEEDRGAQTVRTQKPETRRVREWVVISRRQGRC